MEAFTMLRSLLVSIDRANVDTDAILPKQFMKSIRRTGFGANLFDEWRYLDKGDPGKAASLREPNLNFPLNQTRYSGAQIMLARENFGCGSSREHAVWALRDFGIRALIAPSFADIFYGNCLKNGLLPIVLPAPDVDILFAGVSRMPGFGATVDLQRQVVAPDGRDEMSFSIDPARKKRLLEGLDDIGITLQHADRIRDFENRRRLTEPWLF
ncbi:3-isopropylmalate dehydratase small subunit [Variovorax paradoxus]|uniref:3-isopropylmalate dehydratase small subunit n=1 Tax=Variovorax paradoxus TaxID=34073 RepID=A0A0H2LR90_VARPD|nr:3-isopropylmalate dehydratase small subunit [Variovorax paradoxus]KLN52828.1 3-isopropylmalate dehydratase small subunit 1 [Variovorax paradoxus]